MAIGGTTPNLPVNMAFKLPIGLVTDVRLMAAHEGCEVTEILERALRRELKNSKATLWRRTVDRSRDWVWYES